MCNFTKSPVVCVQRAAELQIPYWSASKTSSRGFASTSDEEEPRIVGSASVNRIADEIVGMSLLDVADLTTILKQKLGMDAMPFYDGRQSAAAPAAAAPEAAVAEVKTEFDLKLDGYDEKSKIKVIKEVRGILPELGLKEAKELVSSAFS